MIKICEYCQKEFKIPQLKNNGGYKRKYCNDVCQKAMIKKRIKDKQELAYTPNNIDLIEENNKALAKGLSYGKYQAAQRGAKFSTF